MVEGRLDGLIARLLRWGVYASGALLVAGLALGSAGMVRAGIAVLVATPVLRVLVLTAGYARAGEWRFAAAGAAVLAMLALSLALGRAH